MKCGQARRLFGVYWDDEITRAEREWLEGHFLTCTRCRNEYETFARASELVATLPRVEPAPDLVERTLARARRASATPDVLPVTGTAWVPATAAAVILVLAAGLLFQWMAPVTGPRPSGEPMARGQGPVETLAESQDSAQPRAGETLVAAVPDSIFDPSEDIEFVLDAVTLRRGRATVERGSQAIHAEQAVISF